MKIRIACLDQELLWFIDDVISGLYSVNLRTFETQYVVDCRKLFLHEKFKIQSLVKWKEDYIVIVPQEINRTWLFYNKRTKEIQYRKIVENKYEERLIAIDTGRNRLYFFPLYMNDPALIIELNTLTCFQTIKDWSGKVSCDYHDMAWSGTCNGRYTFYPQKDTNILVRIGCENSKVTLLELDIPEGIIDVNYAFEELWVLPIKGNRIYQIDENGGIINIVDIIVENTVDSILNFARIVVQKRYLFLLPTYHKGIYIYDKQRRKTYIIPDKELSLEENEKKIYLRYWEYCVWDSKICFLPFQDEYIEIDLDTLACKQKKLIYPSTWSEGERIENCIYSHVSEQNIVIEKKDECDFDIFLKYIQYKKNKNIFSKMKDVGNRIWSRLNFH